MEHLLKISNMEKHYVTFGQCHVHEVNGIIFDKDCVAIIKCSGYRQGRNTAFKLFGDQFGTSYHQEDWNEDNMKYFPRGYIEIDANEDQS